MSGRRLHAADRALIWLILISAAMNAGRFWGAGLIPAAVREDTGLFAMMLILQEILFFGLPALMMSREMVLPAKEKKTSLLQGGAVAGTALLHQGALTLLTLVWSGLLSLGGLGVTVSNLPLPETAGQTVLTLGAYALAPALCEEWLFRGRVLPRLAGRFSQRTAFGLTALCFALMHGNISALPSHLAAGAMLTALCLKYGLGAAMGYHLVFNGASLALAVLDARFGWQEMLTLHPPLLLALMGLLLLLGGAAAWGVLKGLRLGGEKNEDDSPLTGYLLAGLLVMQLLPYGLQLLPV